MFTYWVFETSSIARDKTLQGKDVLVRSNVISLTIRCFKIAQSCSKEDLVFNLLLKRTQLNRVIQ